MSTCALFLQLFCTELHIKVCCPAQILSERLTKVNLGDLETYADGKLLALLQPGGWSPRTSSLDERRLSLLYHQLCYLEC